MCIQSHSSSFIFALKTFDLSLAYAICVGPGIVIVSIIGIRYFKEPANTLECRSRLWGRSDTHCTQAFACNCIFIHDPENWLFAIPRG
ncbi:MAG: hypothetical protein KAU52_06110 [Methanosarcinales archaeon]|nr:hypothetical protein [Methanosarcinales archaeon]